MALNLPGAGQPSPPSSANPFLVIILVATLAMVPALLTGAMRNGIDSIIHARWMTQFSRQFWQGELYPRWLMDLNDGFGSPAFFIYPPFSQYITALLHPLVPAPGAAALLLGISAWLSVVLSGLACFLWLHHAVPDRRSAALIGALAYVLAPYHLYVDVYQRGALAEVWAFVWPPLSLLLLHRLDRFRPGPAAGLALSLAGLLVTHAPSVLILFPAYFLYAVLLDWKDRRFSRAAWLVVCGGLGGLLAGWYLGTALLHTRYINTDALFGPRNNSSNWLIGGDAWSDPAIERDIYIAVSLQGIVGLAAAAAAFAKSRRMDGALPLAALLLAVVSLFMMTIVSRPIWDLGLPINRIQFPWRFSLLLSLAGALAVALAASRLAPRLAAGIPPLFFAANILLYTFPAQYPLATGDPPPADPTGQTWDAGEYRLARKDQVETEFAPGERARLASGTGAVAVIEWRPRAIKLDVETRTPSIIAVRQFNYPGWTVGILLPEGGEALLSDKPYLQVAVPPGRHTVELTLAETAEERIGRISSAGGLAVTLCLATIGLARRRPVNPRSAEPRIPA